jgi:mono/diheme cytochrome c family protein
VSHFPSAAVGFALLPLLAACERRPAVRSGFDPGPVPTELAEGERLYNDTCARCHGVFGAGSDTGPPLVDIIYEPNHHADIAFQRAVALGVAAHHWRFGNMPPVPGVDTAAVGRITAYVRWLQREAGIE